MVGGKVVGTMEGLHYSDEIWKAMSKEQKAQVAELRKARKNERAVKAASTAPDDNTQMEVVSDHLENLTHVVQSLDSSRDRGHWSGDHHAHTH